MTSKRGRSINPDDFLETPGGRVWSPERSARAWLLTYRALDEALRSDLRITEVVLVCGLQGAGKSTWIAAHPRPGAIYFDAALPGACHRRRIVEIAVANGRPIDAVWIRVPVAAALARNAGRAPDKRVPEAAILSVAARFESPTRTEGFRDVTTVDV